jgi:phytol kinase
MSWAAEIRHAVWVGAALALLLVSSELWSARRRPPAELTRKLVHSGAGLIALSFAWLFHSHWTVLVLCVLFGLLLLVARRRRLLESVHGVGRQSRGDLFFPVATYLSFLMASLAERPLFYLIAMGLLAFSDSFAALVGTRYGQRGFVVEGERKSLEGSLIFFLSAFLIVHLALLFGSDLPRLHSVLIACWVAAMVTGFEAISCHGADNLWIPLGTIYLLWKIMPKGSSVLILEIVTLAVSVALCFLLLAPRRTLDHTAILGIALLVDGALRLLDWSWALPLLTAIVLFGFSGVVRRSDPPQRFQIRSVFYAGAGLLVWLLLSNLSPPDGRARIVIPYLSCTLALLSIGWSAWQRTTRHSANARHPGLRRLGRLGLLATLLILPQTFLHPTLLQPFNLVVLVGGAALTDLAWARLTQGRLAHLCSVGRVRLAGMLALASSGALYLVRGVAAS